MDKLISFIVPSRNLSCLEEQLETFEKTTANLDAIEFLIKLDSDHPEAKVFIEEQIKKRKFTIKYLITPRLEGTFSLWMAVEQLFFMISKDSYFVQVMSDEPFYKTHHWDNILRKYMHLFPDDVFRLRLSSVKFLNYTSHYECTFRCDSFPIYTKKWLELTEGIGDCWGSDAYQQCVAFHLALGPGGYYNYYREGGVWRDVPVLDLEMGGLEFGVGIDPETQKVRHIRNLKEWRRLTSFKMQERFSYLARRINCYLWARENNETTFSLEKNTTQKTVAVINEHGKKIKELSYKLPWLLITLQNTVRDIKINYYLETIPRLSKLIKHVELVYFFLRAIKRLPSYCKNTLNYLRLFISSSISKLMRSISFFINNIISITSKLLKLPLTQIKKDMKNFSIKSPWLLKYLPMKKAAKQPLKQTPCVNELISYHPPGIDFLFTKVDKFPPGVKAPSATDILFGLDLIENINNTRLRYRKMVFSTSELTNESELI